MANASSNPSLSASTDIFSCTYVEYYVMFAHSKRVYLQNYSGSTLVQDNSYKRQEFYQLMQRML